MAMGVSRTAAALGREIRRQREQSEISMRRFASMAGISNPYLSQIERGLRAPSGRVIDAIARSLDTSVETLYEEAGLDPEEPVAGARQGIEADPSLTGRQRRALLEVYDGFVALNARGARRGSR